jgi:uncharacterized membrane protein YozB (DUF420 family)
MDVHSLPALNAALNGLATVLLVWGRLLIARKRVVAHRNVMLSAFAVSSLFLGFYVLHKVLRNFESTTFHAEGAAKVAYLAVLFTHIPLAMTVPVFAIVLIRLGLTGRLETHRRIARWAWPIWMYVSLTGVGIYFALYHLNPAGP